ncbi:hypothetical protein B0H21DRAFT_825317 [Amylocystis lapponica]|nr:hypothetical protein B0H21DRAFT_825317 [Amylocystis lapponica]
MSKPSKPNPLPLSDTLRDLALLRSADCDLASILPSNTPSSLEAADASERKADAVEESVERSYVFAREARGVSRLLDREEVEKQGGRLEVARERLEDVLQGLEKRGLFIIVLFH